MIEVTEYEYKYPMGLALKPGSKSHDELLGRLMKMANASKSEMSKRYPKFDNTDKKLCAYVEYDEEEASIKSKDSSKPVKVVVPTTYAIVDTILTYLMQLYDDVMIFRYEGVGPEDDEKARILELVVNHQCQKIKALLDLYVFWRDSICYGLGVIGVRWDERWGKLTRIVPDLMISDVTGTEIQIGHKKISERVMLHEGNAFDNINVRHYFPDPSVPCHKVQDGEFVCILNERNIMSILENERNFSDVYFNGRYLQDKKKPAISKLRESQPETDIVNMIRQAPSASSCGTMPVDVLSIYATIIPKEWKVGKNVYPEKWLFEIAGDSVLIRAQPMGLNHDKYPVAVVAPTFDGYSIAPVSLTEIVYELQVAIDWLYEARLHNVRTSLNNRMIVDPYLVRYDDVVNGKPGAPIRTREHAWGRGVQNAVEFIQTPDVTRGHWNDIGAAQDVAQRASGAVDTLQGVVRPSGERRSATEMRDARMSAVSRVQKLARLISLQGMTDIGYMMASHTQQFMSKPTWINITGEHYLELSRIAGKTMQVNPEDIILENDIFARDATSSGGEVNTVDMMQLFQITRGVPETAIAFDGVRQVLDIYRRLGAKDPSKFLRAEVEMLPDEQAIDQAERIGAVPVKMGPIDRGNKGEGTREEG